MDGESDEDENELARVKCGECECDWSACYDTDEM